MGFEDDAPERRQNRMHKDESGGNEVITLTLSADERIELDRLIKVLVALRRIAPVLSWAVRMIIVIGAAIAVVVKWNLLSGGGK